MMLEKDDWKIAVEDARARQTAMVGLMLFNDGQAMSLLRLCVTLATASAAGFATKFPVSWMDAWNPLLIGLFAASLGFTIASAFCLAAMKSARLGLPGRGAEFWLWASDPSVARESVFREYLQNLKNKSEQNAEHNRQTSWRYRTAKIVGLATPAVSLGIAILSMLATSKG